MIDLDEDRVSLGSAAVDFLLLSTVSLHGLLHSIQESLSLLHSRIHGVEIRIAMVDL